MATARRRPNPLPVPEGKAPMATQEEDELEAGRMPLLDHLIELRNRLMYSAIAVAITFAICFAFKEKIYAILAHPLASIPGAPKNFIYTDLTEAFFTYIKVSFWAAICLAFPVIASQIWMFVAPGLYKNERRAFLPYLLATPILFIMGGSLAYFVVFPLAWTFFASFQTVGGPDQLPIELQPKINEYLSLVMTLIFGFGFAFQMPVLLTLMARVDLISSKALKEKRRYAIVIMFVVAAVLTPPDVISQVSLAVPLLALYEISIWSCRLVEKQRAERQAKEDAELGGGT
jgi:sec-independent protein translocase protein TatC